MSKNKLAAIIVACTIAIVAVIVITRPSPTPTSTPTPTYTLSVSVSPSGAGAVSPSGGEYDHDTQVALTASPASGYTFDYWSGSASDSTSTITITMNSNKSLTANFKTIPEPEPTPTQEVIIEYSATTASQISQFDTVEPGNVYLILDLNIENRGYESVSTGSWNFDVIVDYVKYSSTFVGIENRLKAVSLLDGGKTSGKMVFEVPQNVMSLGYQPVYDAGWPEYNVKWIEK